MKHIKKNILIFLATLMTGSVFAQDVFNLESQSTHAIAFFINNAPTDIFVTYGGYLALSQQYGQITLPRRTQQKKFHLMITDKITPVFTIGNTVSHLAIPEDSSSELYLIESVPNENKRESSWNVTKVDLPKERYIPLHTIVIFAKPGSINVPLGTHTTPAGSQLVLPSLDAQEDNQSQVILEMLNIKPFLAPLKKSFQALPYGYAEHWSA